MLLMKAPHRVRMTLITSDMGIKNNRMKKGSEAFVIFG